MTCTIITIGDELLIGQTIDTNSAWIAQQMNLRGIDIERRIAVADTREAIIQALDETVGKNDYIIVTGGLGPTSDDVTKPVLCEYFGGKMVINETVLHHVKNIFARYNRPMPEDNARQAEVPDNCTVLFNSIGTAPGMWFEKSGSVIISLPGVPFEMKGIMQDEALPRIDARPRDGYIIHQTLITAGVGESYLSEQIKDIETALPGNIHLSYLPAPGIVKLRLTGKGRDYRALKDEIDIHTKLIQQRLGNVVAADEDLTMEQIVVKMLQQHRLRVTFAESCTGGYVASRVTNVTGASQVFNGSIVSYANEIKNEMLLVPQTVLDTVGAVSEATVVQMAKKALNIFHADIAVAISGILGPDGGSKEKPVGMIWMAVADKEEVKTRLFNFRYGRLENKELAATHALDLVRKWIIEHF